MLEKDYCFICQRFDGGIYDKRYKDIIEPVIQKCDLVPYRVDEDPSVDGIFDDIKLHIMGAQIVVAEISTDNPNVWLEIGLAIAYDKPIVFLCDSQRQEFPFDIRHRKVLVYKSESPADFNKLKKQLKEQIVAKLDRFVQKTRPTNKEIAFLKAIGNKPDVIYMMTDKEKKILSVMTKEEKSDLLSKMFAKEYIQHIQQESNENYVVVLTDRARQLKAIRESKKGSEINV